jgi:IS30 family transposase
MDIRMLHKEGHSIKAIARQLGRSRNTVRCVLREAGPPTIQNMGLRYARRWQFRQLRSRDLGRAWVPADNVILLSTLSSPPNTISRA